MYGRAPELVWFCEKERILSPEEQADIIARLRLNPAKLRWRSDRFWRHVERSAA